MDLRTDLIDGKKANACRNIAELLTYLVDVLGTDLYSNKQLLSNLINDLSHEEQRVKRFYMRAIKDDEIQDKVLSILNFDVSEQTIKLKQIILQFSEDNTCSISHAADLVNAFAKAISLEEINVAKLSANRIKSDKSKKVIVVDTSVLLKRPAIVSELLEKFDEVIIPKVVIGELNYQKDHGNPQIKQKAWLVLNGIGNIKNNRILFPESYNRNGINDERIANVACEHAKKYSSDKVYMLARDVYFPLLTKGLNNLKMLTFEDYIKEFPDTGKFDTAKTQQFIICLKRNDFSKLKSFKGDTSIDTNFIDPETGFTPLIFAVRSKNLDVIKYLVSEYKDSIDLDKRDKFKYNFTPLLHAVQLQRLDILKLLFEAGADIDVGSSGKNAGNTPLMVCAWHGFYEGAKFFVEKGACLNQQDSNGFTALTKACIKGVPKVAELLIDKTDLAIRSRDNKKAFEYIEKGKPSSAELFNMFKNRIL
ncbi:MAG: ankyrin repeat domain-containing protein [Prevotellaceae bacterium]|jgi:rRNA-processing protein FCF1|nr:ankyrin repeat domain-containing protein [Prevotellaceae bacterium]